MTELNKQIRYFIHYKIKTDTKWQKIKVIFSGSDVPGEGEHKLMNYLRNESQLKNNEENSNLRHCIYGLDADLIILGLISHQHYFCILREKWA